MSPVSSRSVARIVVVGSLVLTGISSLAATDYGVGRPATMEEIRTWDIDVSPSGEGLPSGRGTVSQGALVYAKKCAGCHGATGREGPFDKLVGGRDTLATGTPVKTIGSYWPYATTLFDYIYRAMPFDAPQSLTPNEVYAVTAWLLAQNGIVEGDVTLDAASLAAVKMPNRLGFILDPRPDIPSP
ncbi:MAG TPA: cytochrome c [Nitrospira sp.]|nr:cytochrome c [Nitrospira sp.]